VGLRINSEGDFAKMKLYATVITVFGLLSVLACAGTQTGDPGTKNDAMLITPQRLKDIAGIEWHLKKMITDNKSIPLIEDTENTFSCDAEGKVAGVATINRYFGNFNLKENGDIVWNKAFGMTRMAGPPELMAQEAAFMEALDHTSRMYLNGSWLTLINENESTRLEFTKSDS
jgi:heat shock protein HslJ